MSLEMDKERPGRGIALALGKEEVWGGPLLDAIIHFVRRTWHHSHLYSPSSSSSSSFSVLYVYISTPSHIDTQHNYHSRKNFRVREREREREWLAGSQHNWRPPLPNSIVAILCPKPALSTAYSPGATIHHSKVSFPFRLLQVLTPLSNITSQS